MQQGPGESDHRPKRNLRVLWGLGLFILGLALIVLTRGPAGGALFGVGLLSVVAGAVLLELS